MVVFSGESTCLRQSTGRTASARPSAVLLALLVVVSAALVSLGCAGTDVADTDDVAVVDASPSDTAGAVQADGSTDAADQPSEAQSPVTGAAGQGQEAESSVMDGPEPDGDGESATTAGADEGQVPGASATAGPAVQSIPTSTTLPLWEATRGDSRYLLAGSFHIATPDIYPLPTVADRILDVAESLLVEVDITAIDPAQAQQLTIAYAMLPDNQTLVDVLPPETLDRVKELLAGVPGLPFDAVQRFRPWLIEQTVAQLAMMNMGFDLTAGIDLYYLNRAATEGTPIVQLESLEQQLEMLSEIDIETQTVSLEYTMEQYDELGETLDQVYGAWKRGDVDALEDSLLADYQEAGLEPQLEVLFFERNHTWMGILEAYAADNPGTHTVVVGAGHMVGDEGLLALLQAAGWEVRQLTVASEL